MAARKGAGPARDGDRGEARTDQLGGVISAKPNPLSIAMQVRPLPGVGVRAGP
jgi:hypothetical protein